jgi:hypothetical protein
VCAPLAKRDLEEDETWGGVQHAPPRELEETRDTDITNDAGSSAVNVEGVVIGDRDIEACCV